MSPVSSYSPYLDQPLGSSGSGLDQLLGWMARDPGLAGANECSSIRAGLAAADGLNRMVIEALNATGLISKSVLTAADVVSLNGWFRDPAHPERLSRFIELHGDDEGGEETGFHHIQNDGGNRQFDGRSLIDTVLDGIYHIGFVISADGTRFTNEDGADNASLTDVARWLTALKVDLATTGTGLDRVVETVVGDPGLQAAIPWADIQGGAQAANNLTGLIVEGMAALNQAGMADADPTRLSADEVRWINAWIRSDPARYAQFVAWHGDDENGAETGFHLVQNDGATSTLFGRNAVNTIFDGLFHIGFSINTDGRFENEDGDANARVADVAEWITYYMGDPSTTGTGLDRLVDWIKLDPGLPRWTSALDINDGLAAANSLNQLFVDAVATTGVNLDGWISRSDLRAVNRWVRANHYDTFLALHGDDEGDGSETGFHKIQNDGATTQFFGRNLVNTVADGIYHYGFEIIGENFVNEDGNTNQSLSDVSGWLNNFLANSRLTIGTGSADTISGTDENDQVLANSGSDLVEGQGGADLLDGGWGKDTLRGGSGIDQIDGGFEDDLLDGGEDGDTYLVTGAGPDWISGVPYSFQGYDTYADSGSLGDDRILAEGVDIVDIGLLNFGPQSGIESIENATEGGAQVRLLGNWQANRLDFSATQLNGGNFAIDAAGGNDTVIGSDQADDIRGGGSDDQLDGAAGADTYRVSGAGPEWIEGQPYTFEGYDTYTDSGDSSDGNDSILAEGDGPVDVGLLSFGPQSGIELIVNATTGPFEVRLLGNWQANRLDFSVTQLVGSISIDGGGGNDSVTGTAAADRIRGGGSDDHLNGGGGGDTYEVSGHNPSNPDWNTYDFEGFDTYADSGDSSDGVDAIVAVGNGPVDIGVLNLDASSGIEQIVNQTSIDDGNGGTTTGAVGLVGNWQANRIDVSGLTLLGGNFRFDGGGGNDTIVGTAGDDRILGGRDNDLLQGGSGDDTYEVSGRDPANHDWNTATFEGYDTYADSAGSDRILIVTTNGTDGVDIGLLQFNAVSGIELIDASTTSGMVRLLGNWQGNSFDFTGTELRGGNIGIEVGDGNDTVVGSAAADGVQGGYGNDLLRGLAGNDSFTGGGGDDSLDGGEGSDTYWVSGVESGGWKTFAGYDAYSDSGTVGTDRIVAVGVDAVDIALAGGNFLANAGIEQIVNQTVRTVNGLTSAGNVRLMGNWASNTLNFAGVAFLGGNIRIDAAGGNDTVSGSSSDDRILGGTGDDVLNGAGGSDTYEVAGTAAAGFQGYDTYADSGSGAGELDRIVTSEGSAAVDIGLRSFVASGIEVIDATASSGAVRLLGDSTANILNFSGVSLLGGNLSIDAGGGNDSVTGSAAADRILAGTGDDSLKGGGGSDTYEVGGTAAASFQGYDTWVDGGSGAGEIDRIVAAAGTAAVDIGLRSFSAAATGIEVIDATSTSGAVRLLGDSAANNLNFSGVSLLGTNLSIDAGGGNDLLTGSAVADRLLAGTGDDTVNGGGGSDSYEVGGNSASGFQGYDIRTDSGTGAGEIDRIVASAGTAAVDIGLRSFSAAATGIEVIDATTTSGAVRLLGDSAANNLNFSGVSLLGSNLSIDAGSGNDTVAGSSGADRLLGGSGNDAINTGGGNDTINGGGGLDLITGGSGADAHVYTTLTDGIVGGSSSAPSFERIQGFEVGLDSFDVATAPPAGSFLNLGAVSALTTSGIGMLLNTTTFVANGAATFTYGSGASLRTFIAFNNGTAGFVSTTDAVLEITGYNLANGASSLAAISIV